MTERLGIGNTFRRPDPDFEPAAEHCLVDGKVGLLLGRSTTAAYVVWVDGEEVCQGWVEVGRARENCRWAVAGSPTWTS